ncbi:hypothetical protein E1B28_010796 [Marasmius oreades]|uniref:Uncharacterized protein n=1 Tax=Marasmius oreades TaxID=181124 RepID=A0A9P7UNW3_9AGAR|nr:uncharacterized protein E1B28_010796 [Marasmius oreades]KAG7089087.1 hypothetical protein E1B28_010796 [Marasmius oreades]
MAQTKSHPSYLLVENVVGFEVIVVKSSSIHLPIPTYFLKRLLHTLSSWNWLSHRRILLTPFDVPNLRLRYYLLARQSRAQGKYSHLYRRLAVIWTNLGCGGGHLISFIISANVLFYSRLHSTRRALWIHHPNERKPEYHYYV